MLKSKLIRAAMLGICLSAFSTNVAFAQMATEPSTRSATQVQAETDALYVKQSEIDQYLFKDHSKEIEQKGIFVNYTGVVDNYIEIGISPYSDDNANYLYEIFGKDTVKVVEFDESIIYATTVVDPISADGNVVKGAPDEEVSVTDDTVTVVEDKVYKDGDVQIQIESTDGVTDDGSDTIYYTTTSAEGQEETDVKVVSVAETPDAVKRGEDQSSTGVSAPIIVLGIAAVAAVAGGAILVTIKKKTSK